MIWPCNDDRWQIKWYGQLTVMYHIIWPCIEGRWRTILQEHASMVSYVSHNMSIDGRWYHIKLLCIDGRRFIIWYDITMHQWQVMYHVSCDKSPTIDAWSCHISITYHRCMIWSITYHQRMAMSYDTSPTGQDIWYFTYHRCIVMY